MQERLYLLVKEIAVEGDGRFFKITKFFASLETVDSENLKNRSLIRVKKSA